MNAIIDHGKADQGHQGVTGVFYPFFLRELSEITTKVAIIEARCLEGKACGKEKSRMEKLIGDS